MDNLTYTFKRREVKYLLAQEQRVKLMNEIEEHIKADKFGKSTICNVYYDTPDSRLIRRSLEKPTYKEKLRVRSYGRANEDSTVFVELKKKYKGVVYKRRVTMTSSEADEYLSGHGQGRKSQICDEIDYFLEMYKGISPAMSISYDRQAFYDIDNPELRLTFDENILWRKEDLSTKAQIYGNSILEDGQSLMEIKCADAMPLWLTHALTDCRIYSTSFSKYGRAYTENLLCGAERRVQIA